MSWYNAQETHLNNLAISGTDPIRIAGNDTGLYAVVRTGTRLSDLKLVQLNADGSQNREVGSLFTGSGAIDIEVDGLAFDGAVLRALIWTTGANAQALYPIDLTTGRAGQQQNMQGSTRFKGLAKVGTALITQGSANALFNINVSNGATTPRNANIGIGQASQRGMVAHGTSIVALGSNGQLSEHNTVTRANTTITWTSPASSGMSGVGIFGNNLIIGRARTASQGNTYLLRNTEVTRVGTLLMSFAPNNARDNVTAAVVDDTNVYITPGGGSLYRFNPSAETLTLVGATGVPASRTITTLVWGASNNTLYGFANQGGAVHVYSFNTTTGRATYLGTSSLIRWYVGGRDLNATTLALWDFNGTQYTFNKTTRVSTQTTGALGQNRGGFFADGHYYIGDNGRNIRKRAEAIGSAVTTVLTHDQLAPNYNNEGIFHVGGDVYRFATHRTGNGGRIYKLDALFPEFVEDAVPVVPPDAVAGSFVAGLGTIRALVGSPGSTNIGAASGGTGTVSYSLQTIVAGITLNNRALNIASTVPAGQYRLAIRATWTSGSTTAHRDSVYTLTVVRPVVTQAGTFSVSAKTEEFTIDEEGTFNIDPVQGGAGTVTYTLVNPPAGFSISGTAITVASNVAAGTYTLNVRATWQGDIGAAQSRTARFTLVFTRVEAAGGGQSFPVAMMWAMMAKNKKKRKKRQGW